MRNRKWMAVVGATGGLLAVTALVYNAYRAHAAGTPTTDPLFYGGFLEQDGTPVAGSRSIEVHFSDVAGTRVCSTVPGTPTEVTAGRFRLRLDDACVDAIAQNPDLFSEVVVDGVSLGRAKLGAMPYALEAARASDLTPAMREFLVPSGAILMWSGALAEIPAGWALCDGTNGTPDLRDRFVSGVADAEEPGATGGANSVTAAELPAHAHDFTTGSAGSHGHSASTSSAGAHEHTFKHDGQGVASGTSFSALRVDLFGTSVGATNTAGAHTHSVSVSSGGSHTHSGTTAQAGSGAAFDNRPAFYKLAFIMKL